MDDASRTRRPAQTAETLEDRGQAVPIADLPILSVHGGIADDAESAPASPGEAELTVRGVLGVGGMGRVLLGHQRSLRRDVAMKVLHAGTGDRGALVREARIVGALEHPNVVPVHLLARTKDETPFFVMKRVEGVRWLDLLRDPEHPHWARMPASADRLAANLEIFAAVCNAVAFANERGFVHRDIKPENVMVGAFGEVYLTDWGVALDRNGPMRTGVPFAGTPSYAAPEMIEGDERAMDARTDVFLLGATLHHVLVGHPRHAAATAMAALTAAADPQPYAYGHEVPAALAELCNRATAADRDARPATAIALRDAVREHLRRRDALALIARAAARVDAIVPDAPEVDRAMLEARIALEGAESIWPANPDLRPLRERALRAMARVEIAREQEHAARARLTELAALGAPAGDEGESLRALEARLRDRREREGRLTAMERDLDMSEGAASRGRLFTGTAIVVLATAATNATLRVVSGDGESAWPGVVSAIVLTIGFAIVVATQRAALFGNTASRRAVATLGVLFAATLLHRVVAAAIGATMPAMLAIDLAGLASIAALGAVFGYARLRPVAALSAACALIAALVPAWATAAYLASIAAFLVVAWRARNG